jgi:hypothetical protein
MVWLECIVAPPTRGFAVGGDTTGGVGVSATGAAQAEARSKAATGKNLDIEPLLPPPRR